jgi:hypothetical protein
VAALAKVGEDLRRTPFVAKDYCEANAADKKLSAAAKTSFLKKCEEG